jgi:hypothetical protein
VSGLVWLTVREPARVEDEVIAEPEAAAPAS